MKRQLIGLGADQAVSSLITLVLSVYAARDSSVNQFGIFAVTYAIFFVLLGLSRSFVGEVNLITGRAELDRAGDWRSFSSTAALIAGLASGIILLASSGVIAPADARWIPWSFVIVTPVAVLADTIRYTAFTDELHDRALTVDLIWLCGALLGAPAVGLLGIPPIPAAILGWGLGAGFGIIVAMLRWPQVRPRMNGARSWIADRRTAGAQYAADFVAASGIGQAATALIPLVASLAVAGGLRAGYVITGPLNVAYSAMIVYLIPRIRLSLSHDRVLPRPAPVVWSVFATLCGLYAVAVVLIPYQVGEFLLGSSWYSGQSAAPALIAAFLFISIAQVLVQVMRLRGSAGLVVRVRLFASAFQSGALLAGAAAFGAVGAATASALAALISVAAWWIALLHSHRSSGGDS
ncbi:hypothetical protein KXD97_15035 [Mycobacterium sp. SMC-8]|uniref:hypothetical protein n=1 Tax=Mycobacterium sp. SMC-8 TaxID=2857060 RepID=UPI0021B30046|nr:hypothetical protein [Mycobacterium sp. SMC-8]UXA14946.1 hypothetical protein KXD97_15035 [Mycobacterium sp. SMC-8]